MKEKSFRPFQTELLLLILTIIIAILAVVEGSNAIVFSELNREYQASEAKSIRGSVERILTFQDQAYLLYEQQLEERMKKTMVLLQQRYRATDGDLSRIDLEQIRLAIGEDIDLFILDEENRVIRTSFGPDLGLIVVKERKALEELLQQTRQTGEYLVDRSSVSNYDGIKKFAYQGTPDRKYIMEVGISLTKHHKNLSIINFETVVGQLLQEHDMLAAVRIYDRVGAAFTTESDGSRQRLLGPHVDVLYQAVKAGKVQSLTEGNLVYEYLPLASQKEYLTGKVVEIVFDTTKWQKRWQKYLLIHGIIAVVVILAGVLSSLWLTKRAARPILQLSQSVRRIAAGDFSESVRVESNSEIGLLAADVDTMRQKLAAMVGYLEDSNQQLVKGYDLTIRAFFKTLEHRESGTASHSLRVNQIAMDIGRQMELTEGKLLKLEWGTLLHDIGKLVIGDAILLKPGPLTVDEYEAMKKHPCIGYEVLQDASYLREALEISLFHHENYDGTGYPNQLKGEAIPLLARICAVADAFEAMTADRPYRKGMSTEAAVVELRRCAGTQFDPAVVEAFLKLSLQGYEINKADPA